MGIYFTGKIKKGRKIAIILCLVFAIILPFFVSCSQTANGYDFEVISYTMDAVIDEYGDMHVMEKLTNDYFNRNSVFFKNLVYGKNNEYSSSSDQSSLVEDVRLVVEDSSGVVFDTDTSNNTPNHFVGYSYNNDIDERGLRIKCDFSEGPHCEQILYYNSEGIAPETTFTYYYTIKGVVTEYKDISEFNWVMLDNQPMNFNNVKISITLPDGDYDIKDMNTYFHGTSYGKRKFVSNNKIVITADKLVSGEKIETRLLLDKEVFSSIRDTNKWDENRENILIAYEKDQIKKGQIETLIYYWGSIVIYAIAVLSLVFLAFRCYKKYDKEFVSEFYNEYYRELPADYSPAVMGYLYNFKSISNEDLTATLLDLIRRKHLKLVNKSTSVNEDNPDFEIWKNEEKGIDKLAKHEKYLIEWFIDGIGDGKKVSSRMLSSYCDDYACAIDYQSRNTEWVIQVQKEAEKHNFFDKTTHNARTTYALFSGIAFLLLFVLVFMNSSKGYDITRVLISSLIPLIIAYILYVTGIFRRTKQGNEDYVRWKAFKKFLEEFSNFEDYPVPSLIIWEHYLVYATSFGIADKVMKQLKLKFSVETVNEDDLTFVVYYGLRYNNIVHLNRSVYGARNSAMSTIARHNASRSNGSFGGGSSRGGFSGGSSRGGGGGSFGGR